MQQSKGPSTTIVTEDDLRQHIRRIIDDVTRGGGHRVVIERDGAPVAAMIAIDDLHWLDELRSVWERDFAAFVDVGRAFGDATDEEIEREADKAIAEIRAEARAEATQTALVRR